MAQRASDSLRIVSGGLRGPQGVLRGLRGHMEASGSIQGHQHCRRQTDGCTEITPCVLKDIVPSGPLPCDNSSMNQLEGSRGQLEGSEGQLEGFEGHLEGSEGQQRGGRTDERTDGRKFSPFYRTSSPTRAAAQKQMAQGQ